MSINCPKCGCHDSDVKDSRKSLELGVTIRRRRVCSECKHRFTTYEISKEIMLGLQHRPKQKVIALLKETIANMEKLV